ncbi:hypothetical protein LXL04_019937 [Taraxacum kok-saghyz]
MLMLLHRFQRGAGDLVNNWYLHRAHYNVELKAVEVGGDILQFATDIFDVGTKRGTIIDSGTTLAYLPDLVYNQVLQKIDAAQVGIQRHTVDQQFTCYKYPGNVDKGYPNVIFHFQNSISVNVERSSSNGHHAKQSQKEKTIYDTIAKSIQSTTVVAYVRGYQTSFDQQLTTKFSIVKAHNAKSLPNAQTCKQKEPTETVEADFASPKKKAK